MSGQGEGGDPGALAQEVRELGKKMDLVLRFLEEQLHLQRIGLLEDRHILRFLAEDGQPVAMSLPQAQSDLIQRSIVKSHLFFEADMLSHVRRMEIVTPQSVVCDVGANIGNHTVYFGRVMGAAKVLSFEPQAPIHATLEINIALNDLQDRVTTFSCLVGEARGSGSLSGFDRRNLGGTSFETTKDGGVPIVALDDVIFGRDLENLDLIKIDVEGMQDQVLKGAEGIIEARRPALWVEILERDRETSAAIEYLGRFGYRPEKIGQNDWLFRV